jgi:pimeloyl-ACP methyl ester carboxylesterase
MLTAKTLASKRHTTRYWQAGPADGPLIIFLHGWPQIALIWRAQMEALAREGWRCIAPDMRGYGASAAPAPIAAYALQEIVTDMLELHDHLGARPAIWAGHDWGSPVAAALAAHHAARCRAAILMSVPYFPTAFALPTLLPLIDRDLYPADQYPDGQWDYYRFYLTHFEQTVSDMNADIPATLAALYRPGNPAPLSKISPSALITRNGGRYGSAHRAPPSIPDPALWPPADFAALAEAFGKTTFGPCNAWYLHDPASIAYAQTAPDAGRLNQPVLYLNGIWDPICDITRSRLGEPMRDACKNLTVTNFESGHWLPLERKAETIQAILSWIEQTGL